MRRSKLRHNPFVQILFGEEKNRGQPPPIIIRIVRQNSKIIGKVKMETTGMWGLTLNYFKKYQMFSNLSLFSVGKQTHDLTVIASDSKTTQSGGDNRKKFPLGAALQVPQNFSFAPL